MNSDLPLILPDWPAPDWVRAASTTRSGGVSGHPWDTLNLGGHVGDSARAVESNRAILGRALGPGAENFGWLNQVHGTNVVELPSAGVPEADASVTSVPGQVCVVLTADCLPVLFCDPDNGRVGAAHAGWRGLADGVLEQAVARFERPASVMAWLGPAIGPDRFEVGPEVREAFIRCHSEASDAFVASPQRSGHYLADIYALARLRLASVGVTRVFGGGLCTVTDAGRFFSYRRDGQTGRMASLIYRT